MTTFRVTVTRHTLQIRIFTVEADTSFDAIRKVANDGTVHRSLVDFDTINEDYEFTTQQVRK